jgi:hypothetical protein
LLFLLFFAANYQPSLILSRSNPGPPTLGERKNSQRGLFFRCFPLFL